MSNLTVKTKEQEWVATIDLLRGLYPRWEVTPEQLAAWKERLGMLNQEWLREAIKLMYHRWTGEQPKPKWALQAFQEIRAGHQGVAVGESGAAEIQSTKEKQEWERHCLQCDLDRARNWKSMQEMDAEERTKWAQTFVQRNPLLAERNDPTDMGTWSKTFCGLVCAYRKIELGLT